MGLRDEKKVNKGVIETRTGSTAISLMEEGLKKAERETQNAMYVLGKKVFETEMDDPGSRYLADIQAVKSCYEKEKLWQLYRLSLEDKTKCDSCGAIIPLDSLFCNKCAASVPQRDFSVIGISSIGSVAQPNPSKKCPNCGNSVPEDMIFCEKCGIKVKEDSRTLSNTVDKINKSVCPKCRAKLVEGAMFCEKCGTRIVN